MDAFFDHNSLMPPSSLLFTFVCVGIMTDILLFTTTTNNQSPCHFCRSTSIRINSSRTNDLDNDQRINTNDERIPPAHLPKSTLLAAAILILPSCACTPTQTDQTTAV